jgi:hypothetical protein
MVAVESFWEASSDETLRQGEYLVNCPVPILQEKPRADRSQQPVLIEIFDLIVVTQSCDLEQGKAPLVALCPIFPIVTFEEANPELKRKGRWEEVRKGRVEGLHLLSSTADPADNHQALVVDFRKIYSLPFEMLAQHALETGPRWRLKSPYLEHFSQAFARFFMRVGLPSSIPPFK